MSLERESEVELVILPQYLPLLEPYRFKVLAGGRSRGASHSIATALVYFAAQAYMEIVCFREYQISIEKSSKKQIETIIHQYKLNDEFKITDTYIEHRKTGAIFSFMGLHSNIENVKGMTSTDVAWIEEGETTSSKSWEVIEPTIRKDDSEIWVSFNPRYETDATYKKFFVDEPPKDALILHHTYLDNPFNSQIIIDQAEAMRKKDIAKYNYIWLGKVLNSEASLMVKKIILDSGIQVPSNAKSVLGIDIARSGGDLTTFWMRKGRKIVKHEAFKDMDLEKLIRIIKDYKQIYNPNQINLDSTGHGAWAPDGLKLAGIKVNSVNFASNSLDDATSNMRTYLYSLADKYFDNGGTIPNYQPLIEELKVHKFYYDSKNRMQLQSKEEIRDILGRSPDDSDGFVLCLLTDGDMFEAPNIITNRLVIQRDMRNLMNASKMG